MFPFILLEQESIRADAARVPVLHVVPHRLSEVGDGAVPAHANVGIAAGVPALLAPECGDGLGLLAALALALCGGKMIENLQFVLDYKVTNQVLNQSSVTIHLVRKFLTNL